MLGPKPSYKGTAEGDLSKTIAKDDTETIWRWSYTGPQLYQVVLNNHNYGMAPSFGGLTRAEAATLAGLVLRDPSVTGVELKPSQEERPGDWFPV